MKEKLFKTPPSKQNIMYSEVFPLVGGVGVCVCVHIIHLALLFSFSALPPPPYSHLNRKPLEDNDCLTRKGNITWALKWVVKTSNLHDVLYDSLQNTDELMARHWGLGSCFSSWASLSTSAPPPLLCSSPLPPAFACPLRRTQAGNKPGPWKIIPTSALTFQLVDRLVYYTQPWKLQGFELNLNHLVLKEL